MNIFIIADNQELTKLGLETLAKGFPDTTVAYVHNKRELLQSLQEYETAVVVVDYTLFDFNGIEDFIVINQRFTSFNWIVISEDLTDKFLRNLIYSTKNVSVVFKDSSVMEIKDAMVYASRGERYLCQRVTETLLSLQQRDDDNVSSKLTPTEVEIVKAIAQGKTTKEIAIERNSSIHTINTHRKNIFRKMGVNTAHEAVKYAVRAGLIDLSEYYI